MQFFGFLGKDIGVDLGTTNILVYVKGRGIVVSEPAVAAINNKTNQVLAVGEDAKNMLGRTPVHVSVIKPLVGGVISDFEMTQEMIKHLLKKTMTSSSFLNFQKVVVSVPSNLTEVERKSVEDVLLGSGANKAFLIEEPVAAALGANLPIEEPTANVIVDVGGGTTEIAIISMGGSVVSRSIKVAGDQLNEDIIKFVKNEFKMIIGEATAEDVKISIGSVVPVGERTEIAIRGRDISSGLPREVMIKGTQVRSAISKSVKLIVDSVREVVESTPPELVGDMLHHGIHLCGGGALLKGLDELIAKETGIFTQVVEEPLTCVIRGIGSVIENYPKLKYILDDPLRPKEIIL